MLLTEQTSPTLCISSFRAERFCIASAFKIQPQDRAKEDMHKDEETEVDPGQIVTFTPRPFLPTLGAVLCRAVKSLEFGAR